MITLTQLRRTMDSSGLGPLCERVLKGQRLSFEDGMSLFNTPHVQLVGALANWVREKRHGDVTYFNRNLHINATNVCEADCIFCSFSRLKTVRVRPRCGLNGLETRTAIQINWLGSSFFE